MRKLLLLTDVPPCKTFTGGLVLTQLCRFLPPGSVACFAVVNPEIADRAVLDEEFSWMPIAYVKHPKENNHTFLSLARYVANVVTVGTQIKLKAAQFARQHGIEAIWAVPQGPLMAQLASDLAIALKVPLLTQIYDPPGWWLRANGYDSVSTRIADRLFTRMMRYSERVGAASWQMAEEYREQYGVDCVPLIPSLDRGLCRPSTQSLPSNEEVVITIAGQLYAADAWSAFVEALSSVNWSIAGRKVRLRVLSYPYYLENADYGDRVEFLGWRPQDEALQILADSDINYCPYWFDSEFEVEARLSFPSKLTSYLAAGIPVFFHGPYYSSPAKFLERYDAAQRCYSMDRNAILSSLTALISNGDRYKQLAASGTAAFLQNFTLEVYRSQFASFLDIDESELRDTPEMKAYSV